MDVNLENLNIEIVDEAGQKKLVPALDPRWIDRDRQFDITYKSPPLISNVVNEGLFMAEQEAWLERVDLLCQDLEYILGLSHHRFWSLVVFNSDGLNLCLESYLVLGIRSHDPQCFESIDTIQRAQQNLHRLVFFVYVRMSTIEESNSCRIGASKFGQLVYGKGLIDIPKLMDLCTLYGRENRFALQKIVTNLFENQPSYERDLKHAINTLMRTLTDIEIRFGAISNHYENNEPRKLSEFQDPVSCSDLSWKEILDMTFYLLDTWITLNNFLDVCPRAASIFLSMGFATRIASFYDSLIPTFVEEFRVRVNDDSVLPTLDEAKRRLSFARVCMLKVFRGILEVALFQPILENSASKNYMICAEEFLEVMTAILSEKTFVLDYLLRFPFDEDVELLTQTEPSEANMVADAPCGSGNNDLTDEDELEEACVGPCISNDELASLISHVKDILTDLGLGDGFVEACVEHYNYDCEKVINALLEDSLPAVLNKMDRKLPRILKSKNAISEPSILSERRNVFDNDEFDVFSRNDVDKSRIRKGKQKEDFPELPRNDVTLKSVTVSLASEYERNKQGDLIYDDEYDDTYDANMIGVAEVTGFDDVTERRPFVVPRVLAGKDGKNNADDEDYKEPDSFCNDAISNLRNTKNDFCENPELARERYARYRQQKTQNQGGGGGGGVRDYQGKAKGQGQEESVLKNRSHKEKNKAFHGNHNRRSGSDYKRTRGMIPS